MARPYIHIAVTLKNQPGTPSSLPKLATSLSVLLDDYSYLQVVEKIYKAFDHALPADLKADLEDRLARVMPLVLKEKTKTNVSRVAQRLAELDRPKTDVDRRISLGDIGRVCKYILYADFLQYKPEIQEKLLEFYKNTVTQRSAHDWLYKRGYSRYHYKPGMPGSLFPKRSAKFWQRRSPYENPLGRRGRRVST